jgi:hypothetical protein
LDNSEKIILDLCGGTGAWSKPYRDAGYDVRVITLPEDVRLYVPPDGVHGILAAPPCTEFSFAKHFHGKGKYQHDFTVGLSVVDACLRIIVVSAPAWWAIENPKNYLRRWLGDPTMTFDPWEYGDLWQKKTDVWGDFTVPMALTAKKPEGCIKFSLLKSREIYPELYGTLSRTERRAITPPGFAKAFFEANP